MARTKLNRVSVMNEISINNETENQDINTPSPKGFKVRRATTPTTANNKIISDSESAFDSDSSISSNLSNNSTRRNRKNWNESEEACLISGVAKHGENWESILADPDYEFNDRQSKDLRLKYRSLCKSSTGSSKPALSIFDIRCINEKVTEVFIGSDWSSAQWTSSENIQDFETLLKDFETKIASKQKMINRISPARTPSKFISNLALNSAAKRSKNNAGESSQDENDSATPLKKTKQQISSSPLSVRSSKSNTKDGILVHSDVEQDQDNNSVVYPSEDGEPTPEPKSIMGLCTIM